MFDFDFVCWFLICFVAAWFLFSFVEVCLKYWLRRRNCSISKSAGFKSLEDYIIGGNNYDEIGPDSGRF